MQKCFVALLGVLAMCATLVYVDVADARCGGGRAARVSNRRSMRQGSCGASATYSETHTYRASGGGMFRSAGTCGAGGCN